MMNYLLLNYSALIIYVFMGIYFWKRNPKGKINILFLILSLILAYCSLIQVFESYFINEKVTLYFMDRISDLGWLNYSGVLLWICLIYVEDEKYISRKLFKVIIFLPGILLTIFELFVNDYSLRMTKIVIYFGYIEYFYNYSFAFLCIILLCKLNKKANSPVKRKQSITLLFFGSITIIITASAELLIPTLNLEHVTLLLFIFSIGYVHVHYKILNPSSLITAEDIIEKISDIVITTNSEGAILGINKIGEKILKCKKDKLIGNLLSTIINLDFDMIVQEVMANNNCIIDEGLFIKSCSCKYISIRVEAFAIKDKAGDLLGLVIICQDKTLINNLQDEINVRKLKEEQLEYLGLHDPLTGLFNRAYFEQQIKLNNEVVPIGIMICDIDGLKLINDTLGHDAGDQLLISAANAIKSSLQKDEILFRIGGDEFVILIPHATKDDISNIYEEILEKVKEHNRDNPLLFLSISMGYTIKENNEKNIHVLFKEADDNMYRDKLNHSQSIRNIMVKGMMKTLEARDFITEGHAERLKELVLKFGIYLDLPKDRINNIQLLAQFHDLGKIGIPDRILFKPEALTDSEKVEMQRHCEIGFRIAQTIPDLNTISDLILKHHERWDGNGYPLGIEGEEIPLECRILAIVDAYDAMTSDRPYRKAMSRDKALMEIKNNAGFQFDEKLVLEFFNVLSDSNARSC